MFLPKPYIEKFIAFAETTLGATVTCHEQVTRTGEIGRFVWGDDLVVIRTFGGSASEDATSVEVWTASQLKRDELERNWATHLLVTEIELEIPDVSESCDK